MSRFSPINLSQLPSPDVLTPLDFEGELADLKTDLLARADAAGVDLRDVLNLDTDPLVLLLQTISARLVNLYAQSNEQIRGLILTDAVGPQLDLIAATYYGITRLLVTPADPDAIPPLEAVYEDDETFRARIALAPEAFSTAGPEGGYIFHTLELDGVADIADVAVYSEDDNATYSTGLHADAFTAGLRAAAFTGRATGDPVLSPEVLIVILPSVGYGPCDQALLDRAFTANQRKDTRPIGDCVRIEPALVSTYQVEANLLFEAGATAANVIEAATAALAIYVDSRRRIGARVQRIGIAAALKVPGVQEIDLAKPVADILPGSKGAAELLGDPLITAEPLVEGWRP